MALPKLSAQQRIVNPDGTPSSLFLRFMEETRTGQAAVDAAQEELIQALADAVEAIEAAQAAALAAQEAAEVAQTAADTAQASAEAADAAVDVANLAIAELDDRVTALEAP